MVLIVVRGGGLLYSVNNILIFFWQNAITQVRLLLAVVLYQPSRTPRYFFYGIQFLFVVVVVGYCSFLARTVIIIFIVVAGVVVVVGPVFGPVYPFVQVS